MAPRSVSIGIERGTLYQLQNKVLRKSFQDYKGKFAMHFLMCLSIFSCSFAPDLAAHGFLGKRALAQGVRGALAPPWTQALKRPQKSTYPTGPAPQRDSESTWAPRKRWHRSTHLKLAFTRHNKLFGQPQESRLPSPNNLHLRWQAPGYHRPAAWG